MSTCPPPPKPRASRQASLSLLARLSLLTMPLVLAGCDQLGIESATATSARREAEGKAIGAGCRHAGRSVEVCYVNNKKADKAAVFAGWREMNDYMRENKIDAMPPPPEPPPPPPPPPPKPEGEDGEEDPPKADAGKHGAAKPAKAASKGH